MKRGKREMQSTDKSGSRKCASDSRRRLGFPTWIFCNSQQSLLTAEGESAICVNMHENAAHNLYI